MRALDRHVVGARRSISQRSRTASASRLDVDLASRGIAVVQGLRRRANARQLRRESPNATLFTALGATLVVVVLAFIAYWCLTHRPFPGDTWNYFTAGDRLNRGLPLYAPGTPGSGYAQVAIFSPPLVGAIFRPIATLPWDVAIPAWVATMAGCEFIAIACLAFRRPLLTGLAAVALGPTIMLTVIVGNLDALVLLVCVWISGRLVTRDDDLSGIALGAVASLKLTPAILIWWALVTGRVRTAAVAGVTVIVLAIAAAALSSSSIFLDFFSVTSANYAGSQGPASLAAVGRSLGLPSALAAWLPRLALVAGVASIVVARRRPHVGWVAGIATMYVASPVAALHTPALLLGALAARRRPTRQREPRDGG